MYGTTVNSISFDVSRPSRSHQAIKSCSNGEKASDLGTTGYSNSLRSWRRISFLVLDMIVVVLTLGRPVWKRCKDKAGLMPEGNVEKQST
jgi:hypothetical protein